MLNQVKIILKTAWIGVKSWFLRLNSPFIVVCMKCKKVLHANKKAKEISHGLCWKDFYKDMGGKTYRLPKFEDFEIVKALRSVQPHPTKDETWNSRTLYKGLLENGHIIEEMRRERKSLTKEQADRVFAVRDLARQWGMTQAAINATEMDGEREFICKELL